MDSYRTSLIFLIQHWSRPCSLIPSLITSWWLSQNSYNVISHEDSVDGIRFPTLSPSLPIPQSLTWSPLCKEIISQPLWLPPPQLPPFYIASTITRNLCLPYLGIFGEEGSDLFVKLQSTNKKRRLECFNYYNLMLTALGFISTLFLWKMFERVWVELEGETSVTCYQQPFLLASTDSRDTENAWLLLALSPVGRSGQDSCRWPLHYYIVE